MTTPFDRPYSELDDDEQQVIHAAGEILSDGNRLYGQLPSDLSHVWWAIGAALATLKETHKENPMVVTYIELGIDDSGFFISFLGDEPTPDNP